MRIVFVVVLGLFGLLIGSSPSSAAQTREYFIAADEIDWNYMPGGKDAMMGMVPAGYTKFFAARGPQLNGPIYLKAIYREYTDGTFKQLKPRPAADAYLGIVGPIIRAEVGDTIIVDFRNNGTHSYSMHPHGVFYDKPSEGAPYADGIPLAAKGGDAVAPGKSFDYRWQVPERAGPGPGDPSSIVWLYHSHVDERHDVNAGLVGVIIVTRHGMARPDGSPRDVDREVVQLYMAYDENRSWFIDDNARRFMSDAKKVDLARNSPHDPQGAYDPILGIGPGVQNIRFAINGFQYADGPAVTMKRGAHVRWYLVTIGEGINFHTPHWHGNTVLVGGQRTDVVAISPAQMVTADMVPDDPGTWMMHCHVSDHMEAGMAAFYTVLPESLVRSGETTGSDQAARQTTR